LFYDATTNAIKALNIFVERLFLNVNEALYFKNRLFENVVKVARYITSPDYLQQTFVLSSINDRLSASMSTQHQQATSGTEILVSKIDEVKKAIAEGDLLGIDKGLDYLKALLTSIDREDK
jgi:hypothetical protein